MEKIFKVYYINNKGKELSAQYRCVDKSQARRLFLSKYNEILKRVRKIKE